ncbi:MAG: hypothetical protein ACXWL5_00615 [Candidatus Chromulinivorax sp.]
MKQIRIALLIVAFCNYTTTSEKNNTPLKNLVAGTTVKADTQGLGQKSRSAQQEEFGIKPTQKNWFTKYFCCYRKKNKDKRLLIKHFDRDQDL